MPIPERDELIRRIKSGVKGELPNINIDSNGTFINALLSSIGISLYDIYKYVDLTKDDFFKTFGSGFVASRPAQASTGTATFQSLQDDVEIAENTFLNIDDKEFITRENVLSYTYNETTDIANVVIDVGTNETSVTITMSKNHNFYTGLQVTISGFDSTYEVYNQVDKEIVAISNTKFRYIIEGEQEENPSSSAGVTVTSKIATTTIIAVETGEDYNIGGSSEIELASPIININNKGGLTYDGTTGGASLETDANYERRIRKFFTNPPVNFNVPQVQQKVLEYAGVTRSYVLSEQGSVSVYPVFDKLDNSSPIPSDDQVLGVRFLLESIRPSTLNYNSITVGKIVLKTINIRINAVTPNINSIKEALKNRIYSFFKTELVAGQDFFLDKLKAYLLLTVDENGNGVTSFNIIEPTGNITVDLNHLAYFGTIIVV